MSLSKAQQHLLQIFMSCGVLDQTKFKDVFRSLIDKYNIRIEANEDLRDHYVTFLKEINEHIKDFQMEIRNGTCEISGITFFCLVRQCDTASIGTLSHLYTPAELKLFRTILGMIVESTNGYVDYNNIVHQVNEDYEQLNADLASSSQATKVPSNKELRLAIQKFMHDCWLIEVYNMPNMIALHGRAIIELAVYIKEVFGSDDEVQLVYCVVCKQLLFCGIKCSNCNKSYHRHCAKNLFKNQTKCINCKMSMPADKLLALNSAINEARQSYLQKCSVN